MSWARRRKTQRQAAPGSARLALKPAKSEAVAIVPGKPDDSELIKRITTDDADDHMPPAKSNKKLTAEQVDILKRWVAEGRIVSGALGLHAANPAGIPGGKR